MSQDLTISVVVPTRERAGTLAAALKTVLTQDYPALEVIVSDNASTDNTAEVVRNINDGRVRYFNTGARLAMHQNWDFALDKVRGDFVTVIGDDDGLLPGALSELAALIVNTGAQAICWQKVEYHWPNHPNISTRNRMKIPLANTLTRLNSKAVLRDLCRFMFPYNRTPTLYNSIVSVEALNRAKLPDGTLLKSSSPDVYSGVILLGQMSEYFYSTRPFSVNGGSASSSGTSFISNIDPRPYAKFVSELGDYKFAFGRLGGSVNSELLEALLQANVHHFSRKLRISKRMAIMRIYAELMGNGASSAEAIATFRQVAKQNNLAGTLRLAQAAFRSRVGPQATARTVPAVIDARQLLTLDASRFDAEDVYGAARVAGAILGPYAQPARATTYSSTRRLFGLVGRRLASKVGVETSAI